MHDADLAAVAIEQGHGITAAADDPEDIHFVVDEPGVRSLEQRCPSACRQDSRRTRSRGCDSRVEVSRRAAAAPHLLKLATASSASARVSIFS